MPSSSSVSHLLEHPFLLLPLGLSVDLWGHRAWWRQDESSPDGSAPCKRSGCVLKPGFFTHCEMDEGRRRVQQWPLLFSFQEGFWFSYVLSPASFFLMALRWAP